MSEFGATLLNNVQRTWAAKMLNDAKIQEYARLAENSQDYTIANDFAVRTGELLTEAINENTETLAFMSEEVASELLTPILTDEHNLITEVTKQVQANMNAANNIGLGVQVPDLDTNRIQGLIDKVSSYPTYDEARWVLNEPIINYSQAVVDQSVEKNAKAQAKAGVKAYIVRKAEAHQSKSTVRRIHGKPYHVRYEVPCKWCAALAGRYEYIGNGSNIPRDVYRRHEACRCTLTFEKGKQRQNVWDHGETWTEEDTANQKAAVNQAIETTKQPFNNILTGEEQMQSGLKIPNITEPVRPRLDDYASYDEYEAARNKFRAERERFKQIREEWIKSNANINKTTVSELGNWCAERDIVITNNMNPVDERSLTLLKNRWGKLSQDFPQVMEYRYTVPIEGNFKPHAAYFGFDDTAYFVAEANGGFSYGSIAKDYEKLLAERFDAVTSGYLVRGDGTANALIDHEFGHNLKSAIEHQLTEYDPRYIGVSTRESTERRIAFNDDIKKSLLGLPGISEYATTNEEELFAEAFSAWYGGEDTEFTRAFGDLLKRWLK